ncbi:MAG TPA: N-acetylmuramoyl-L-alanine amidase [Flavisolibacter sp.]|nr:N-acetylmuramoyl-L-alanine amidase [Flavisolibacter sp.]
MKWMVLSALFFFYSSLPAQVILTGRTTGALPHLEYGLGDDRLGGAKMTYLDTNILVKVVDSSGSDYKVQLSAHHAAYLPKQYFKTDTAAKPKASYLSASWKVWGDDQYDYVSLSLPERLPYRSFQQVGPSRIVVDVFGVTSNTNWITQLKTVREISNVWYEQVEDDVFRIFIELRHPQHWGYFIYYNNNALQVRVKRQPSSLKPSRLLVAIDAGHGGVNNGASGLNSKIKEKDYTLMMAKQLKKYLERKNVEVYMTREEDVDISMIDRTLMVRARQPDLLISLHLNSSSNPNAKGTSTYYRYIGFRPLSQAILDRMLELNLNNFGNIGAFNFALSGPTEYPNCLVEVAFLSNADDEKKILDEDFHRQVAKKIYRGLKDWLKGLRK